MLVKLNFSYILYVDMDGVIAEFEYNPISIISEKGYFGERRPMKNMIMALKMLISRNIEIHSKRLILG